MALKPVQVEANRSERKKDLRDMTMPCKACLISQGKPNYIGQKFEVALDEWADIGARQ